MNEIPKEVLEARKQYTSVTVRCPTINENLQPVAELLNCKCPFGKDGLCAECDDFVGFWSDDGTVVAFQSYEGFCKGEQK